MATAAGVLFTLAFLFAPGRGLLARARRRARQRWEFPQAMLAIHLLNHEGRPEAATENRIEHLDDRVVKQLAQDGLSANAIHGNKSQGQRERALLEFRTGQAPILVATDIAARGIDVEAVTHVVQYDLPDVPESYVHRIGRTARAGASGEAVALEIGRASW